MGKIPMSEWFWRFLAMAMLFSFGWTLWVIYQLNPPALATNDAFEAAAKAHLSARQTTQGIIGPATAPEPPTSTPREPLINIDRLKLSESLSTSAKP
jgi:hypothetical protein